MKKPHLLGAALLGLTALSSAAMARDYDLRDVAYPDAEIASARVIDPAAHTLGAVQAITFDERGHARQVEMAFLNQNATVTVDADRFLYDPDSNSLILARPLNEGLRNQG